MLNQLWRDDKCHATADTIAQELTEQFCSLCTAISGKHFLKQFFLCHRNNRVASPPLVATSLLMMLAGLGYYLVFRYSPYGVSFAAQGTIQWLPEGLIDWIVKTQANGAIQDWSAGTFPSLVHMLSLGLLSFGMLGYRNGTRLCILILGITILAEFSVGTTDPFDVFSALLGTTIAVVASQRTLANNTVNTVNARPYKQASSQSTPHRTYTALSSLCILLCSTYFIAGSSCVNDSCYANSNAKPVYMDYNTLRSSVTVEAPKEIGEVKRVYLYQQYIFLNRKNEGIHVIDNTDPAEPTNLGFINIPGNTEVAIRGNYLYADSYIDLVTLDLNDPENIQEVARQEDIFPWNERQNIPDGIYLDYQDIDSNRGVVVSYENR